MEGLNFIRDQLKLVQFRKHSPKPLTYELLEENKINHQRTLTVRAAPQRPFSPIRGHAWGRRRCGRVRHGTLYTMGYMARPCRLNAS